jgi:hypothetical protein
LLLSRTCSISTAGAYSDCNRTKKDTAAVLLQLFQVISDNDQQQPKVEHETEVLGYSRDNGTEIFQIGDKQHDQTNDK